MIINIPNLLFIYIYIYIYFPLLFILHISHYNNCVQFEQLDYLLILLKIIIISKRLFNRVNLLVIPIEELRR